MAPGAPISGARRGRSPGAWRAGLHRAAARSGELGRAEPRTPSPPAEPGSGAKPAEPSPLSGAGQGPRPASRAAEPPSGARPASGGPSPAGGKARQPAHRPSPSAGEPPVKAGECGAGGLGERKRGVSGRFSGALCASAAFFQLLELLRARPSPSSPHPAPSRWPGFTVIPLGAFTGNTSEGRYKKFWLRWLSRENSGGVSVLGCGRRLSRLYYSVVRPLNQLNEPR